MDGGLPADFSPTRISWQLLCRDKKLILFPVLSSISHCLYICCLVVWIHSDLIGLIGVPPNPLQGLQCLLRLFRLFVPSFIVGGFFTFIFQVALIHCVLVRFNGDPPTLRDGLKISLRRLPLILAWAAWLPKFMFVAMGYEFSERMGRFIGGLFGVTNEVLGGIRWNFAPYFALPVLVAEGGRPIQILKRSAVLVRTVEGWSAFTNMNRIGFFVAVAIIPGILMSVVGLFLELLTDALTFKVICLLGISFLFLGMIPAIALGGISVTAMYQYVVLNQTPSESGAGAM